MGITEKAREKRITEALLAYRNQQGDKETLTLEWRSKQVSLPVVEIPLDFVLLNAKSHRLQAQLEDHPESDKVRGDPWSDESQEIVSEVIKRAHRSFDALEANLEAEGQRDAGIITRKGVLINANTRVVALRELTEENKAKGYVRVAVLPDDADPKELAELELRLQVQEELKDDYSLTNLLLFIEEMHRDYRKSPTQIAEDLRWAATPKKLKKAAAEVEQHLRILSLIREMQRVSARPLPLTFFDGPNPRDSLLQSLKELEGKYSALAKESPDEALRLRDNWLCAACAGVTAVHDIRAVDADFVDDYLKPLLEEDPDLGPYVNQLFAAKKAPGKQPVPRGLDKLDPAKGDATSRTDVGRVLEICTMGSKTTFEKEDGKKITLDAALVRDIVRNATKQAIQTVKQEDRAKNKLDVPIQLVRDASTKLRAARTKYISVSGQFNQARRTKLEYGIKQAKKAVADLEQLLKPSAPAKKSKK